MTELTESLSVVEVSAPAEARPRPRWSGWQFPLAFIVMFGIGVALVTVPLPYFVFEPGDTFATEQAVIVEGAEEYPSPDGEVRFVTVTRRRISPIGWLMSSLSDSDEIVHEDDVFGEQTPEEQREINAQQMLSSQNTSVVAALAHLGFDVFDPAGALLVELVEGSEIAAVAEFNDVIDAVDGVPVTSAEELTDVVEAAPAGTQMMLSIRRPDGARVEIEVTTTDSTSGFLGIMSSAATPDDGSGAAFDEVVAAGPVDGILLPGDRIVGLDGTSVSSFGDLVEALSGRLSGDEVELEFVRPDEDDSIRTDTVQLGMRILERVGIRQSFTQFIDAPSLPVSVDFTTEDIGGPSAGLAFTLTILDVLTPGELTGGAEIVATGTIFRNGQVGPIGGVHQKAFAARDAGADVFIVPAANFEEAHDAVPELRIEPVETLDEALAVLADFGGNVDQLPVDGQL